MIILYISKCKFNTGNHISGNLEMSGNSAKVRENAQSEGKVCEFL